MTGEDVLFQDLADANIEIKKLKGRVAELEDELRSVIWAGQKWYNKELKHQEEILKLRSEILKLKQENKNLKEKLKKCRNSTTPIIEALAKEGIIT